KGLEHVHRTGRAGLLDPHPPPTTPWPQVSRNPLRPPALRARPAASRRRLDPQPPRRELRPVLRLLGDGFGGRTGPRPALAQHAAAAPAPPAAAPLMSAPPASPRRTPPRSTAPQRPRAPSPCRPS